MRSEVFPSSAEGAAPLPLATPELLCSSCVLAVDPPSEDDVVSSPTMRREKDPVLIVDNLGQCLRVGLDRLVPGQDSAIFARPMFVASARMADY
jgi:hypothetical protein